MTEKEKALELCNKFMIHNSYQAIVWYNAKQCALIAVTEILFSNDTIFQTKVPHECWKYWLGVKQEIQKL